MTEYLPREIAESLRTARDAQSRRTGRMEVRIGTRSFPILRCWDKGFAVAPEDAPPLRGLVDIYAGGRHLAQALIVASSEAEGERVFEFKRTTPVSDGPAQDYARDDPRPSGKAPGPA